MTIGFSEIAILAMLLCGICWIPAPAFVWHHSGRWLVFSMSLLVMGFCLIAMLMQWLARCRPFRHPCPFKFISG